MQETIEQIKQLCKQTVGKVFNLELLPQSGGDRRYFRITLENKETIIAAFNTNVKENNTFIEFTKHFKSVGMPVSEVLAVNDDKTIYLQTDLGPIVYWIKWSSLDIHQRYTRCIKKH